MDNSLKENSSTNFSPNKINPSVLYGLDAPQTCMSGTCHKNTIDAGFYIPAMNEIVRHNPSAAPIAGQTNYASGSANDNPTLEQAEVAYEQGASTSETIPQEAESINKYSGNLQNIPFVEGLQKIDASVPVLPVTPATTANPGASLAAPIRENLNMSMSDYAYPVTAENLRYHNGFMRTQIGRRVTVDFLVGADTIVQKTGYLLGVAQDYILLNEIDTNDITTCDYYNIKFIKYYY